MTSGWEKPTYKSGKLGQQSAYSTNVWRFWEKLLFHGSQCDVFVGKEEEAVEFESPIFHVLYYDV